MGRSNCLLNSEAPASLGSANAGTQYTSEHVHLARQMCVSVFVLVFVRACLLCPLMQSGKSS